MNPERLQQSQDRVEQLYHAAQERDPDQRAAFLEEACAGDDALRREVESLLAEDAEVGTFMETPAVELAKKISGEDSEQSMIGRQLGPYCVVSLLAKGGMGEVYRARDTKLKREVAIKILPGEFSRDRDRIARFQREAEVLASLNHPNIAAIYDLDEAEGARFLVLEFVEGETLAERIGRGPIPIEQALNIARHICEALEAAHEKGITHRDLKPGNIKLTPDGKVKVLDFGLAKFVADEPSTVSIAATGPRMILGTPSYMSPEQAKGERVDRRADIFAFGCVLYEMLTGQQAFEGKETTEILGRVVTAEPDWSRLPAQTPWLIQRLLRRALTKDAHQRLGDIRDARLEIDEAATPLLLGEAVAPRSLEASPYRARASRARRVRITWFAAVLGIVLTLGAVLVSRSYFNGAAPPEFRFEVNTPSTDDRLSFAISPDGRQLVFVASNEGRSQLWVRRLDSLTAQPLAGTDGASSPFWSPDSASIGFFAEGKLKRMDIAGGAPQVLTDARTPGRGGTWNRDGIIVFNGSGAAPIFKVEAKGGTPVAVTRLETGHVGHRFPQFLPDSRHFIYFAAGPARGIYVGSLDGTPSRRLADVDAAVVSPAGFLLFARQATLFAQAFDFKRLELYGTPFPVAEQVALDLVTNTPGFSAGAGVVAYRTSSAGAARQLTWLDRSGKSVSAIGSPDLAGLALVELSPDGKRVAVSRAVNGNRDVWLIDAFRGVPTRFTFDAAWDGTPVWSPDGNYIAFYSNRKGRWDLYWKLSSGAGAEELLLEPDQSLDEVITPTDWSFDGRFLLFRSQNRQSDWDLWVLPMFADKKPFPFLKTQYVEANGQFSPDGKWIAYESNESGRFEIYIRPFPGPGGWSQISTNGGGQPRWNKNGKEIFYVSPDSKMMATPVKFSPDGQSLEIGTPSALFPVLRIADASLPYKQQYAVSSDGQRFLVNLTVDAPSYITLILNWRPRP